MGELKQILRDTWFHASLGQRCFIVFLLGCFFFFGAFLLLDARYDLAGLFLLSLIALEIVMHFFVNYLSKKTNFITIDTVPKINTEILDKFFAHGHDPELGWIRKPGTKKSEFGVFYEIDRNGSRRNPGHENLPLVFSSYGDSYAFCREVNDDETWQWHLSAITGRKVLNFGVGNYGLDQTIIRLKREHPQNPAPIVIIAVVPQTIARNLSVWKHYNEHGNILGFKPRFILDGENLKLIPNFINTRDKFFRIEEYMAQIQEYDYFYSNKYKKEAFRFPLVLSGLLQMEKLLIVVPLKIIKNSRAGRLLADALYYRVLYNFLKNDGVRQTEALFRNQMAMELMFKMVGEFVEFSRIMDFIPVFLMLPMKEDLYFIRERYHYYKHFMDLIEKEYDRLMVIDSAEKLLSNEIKEIFRKWHYSSEGNRLIAELITERLRRAGIDRDLSTSYVRMAN